MFTAQVSQQSLKHIPSISLALFVLFALDEYSLGRIVALLVPLTSPGLTGTITLKKSTKQDAGLTETVYQSFYGHTSQHQAVIVRSDGSAAAQYPSEGIAVSVDPEQTGKVLQYVPM